MEKTFCLNIVLLHVVITIGVSFFLTGCYKGNVGPEGFISSRLNHYSILLNDSNSIVLFRQLHIDQL